MASYKVSPRETYDLKFRANGITRHSCVVLYLVLRTWSQRYWNLLRSKVML